MPREGRLRIGTSGYVYAHWRGAFYPEDLPARERFAYYARRFDAVEVNNTFYRLPTAKVVRDWAEAAPPGFLYAFKASRYVTHMKRLLPGGTYASPVETLLDRLAPLGRKLGPVLFQLPPRMPKDVPRLRAFLQRIPYRDGVPFAFEFRHASWYDEEVYALLGEHGVAFCIHDWVHAPTPLEVTADLVYVRFHGHRAPYRDLYGPRRLAPWVKRIREWRRQGRDVHAYFNNDEAAYAVRDARWLAEKLGVAKEAPEPPGPSRRLKRPRDDARAAREPSPSRWGSEGRRAP